MILARLLPHSFTLVLTRCVVTRTIILPSATSTANELGGRGRPRHESKVLAEPSACFVSWLWGLGPDSINELLPPVDRLEVC